MSLLPDKETQANYFPEVNNPDTQEYKHNDELKGYTNLAVAYSEAAYMFTDRDSGTAAPVSPGATSDANLYCDAASESQMNFNNIPEFTFDVKEGAHTSIQGAVYEWQREHETVVTLAFRGSEVARGLTPFMGKHGPLDFEAGEIGIGGVAEAISSTFESGLTMVRDWLGTDLEVEPVPDKICPAAATKLETGAAEPSDRLIHKGFQRAWLSAREEVLKILNDKLSRVKLTFTQEEFEAEEQLQTHTFEDTDEAGTETSHGTWNCTALLAWKGEEVCRDPTVEHHDWAQKCPAHCAQLLGGRFLEAGQTAPPIKLMITGHSLGAAIAVLATYDLWCNGDAVTAIADFKPFGTITFGQPIVFYGNKALQFYQQTVPKENRIRVAACGKWKVGDHSVIDVSCIQGAQCHAHCGYKFWQSSHAKCNFDKLSCKTVFGVCHTAKVALEVQRLTARAYVAVREQLFGLESDEFATCDLVTAQYPTDDEGQDGGYQQPHDDHQVAWVRVDDEVYGSCYGFPRSIFCHMMDRYAQGVKSDNRYNGGICAKTEDPDDNIRLTPLKYTVENHGGQTGFPDVVVEPDEPADENFVKSGGSHVVSKHDLSPKKNKPSSKSASRSVQIGAHGIGKNI